MARAINWKRLRLAHGLTQADFWGRIGVQQCNGSKYENGRPMLDSVRLFAELVYAMDRQEAIAKLNALRK